MLLVIEQVSAIAVASSRSAALMMRYPVKASRSRAKSVVPSRVIFRPPPDCPSLPFDDHTDDPVGLHVIRLRRTHGVSSSLMANAISAIVAARTEFGNSAGWRVADLFSGGRFRDSYSAHFANRA